MEWEPISEAKIWDKINQAWLRMDLPQRRLWEATCIDPEKWKQHPYGDLGGGFWAVALLGRTVVWYNDLEDGFNLSRFTAYGVIDRDQYWCNQDELEHAVQRLMLKIEQGYDPSGRAGPPQPL